MLSILIILIIAIYKYINYYERADICELIDNAVKNIFNRLHIRSVLNSSVSQSTQIISKHLNVSMQVERKHNNK